MTVTVYSANQSNLQTHMLKIQSTNLQVKQGIGLQSTVSNGSKSCLQSTIILPILSTIYIQNLGQIYNLQYNHQSWKKGGSTVAMLPEGNSQNHSWQKDFGNSIALVLFFTSFV